MTPPNLPPEWREAYEERAAMIEEGCHMSREEAEAAALEDIKRVMARVNQGRATG